MKVELTVYIPEELRRRLRMHAAETGLTQSRIVELALGERLDAHDKWKEAANGRRRKKATGRRRRGAD